MFGFSFFAQKQAISFLGGPLDGYVETTSAGLDTLPPVFGVPISARVVEMLSTKRRLENIAATSFAFYEKVEDDEGWYYRFLGASSPETVALRELNM